MSDDLKTYQSRPEYLNGYTAPVGAPLVQSAVTGALSAMFAGCLVVVFELPFNAWAILGLTFTGVTLATWLMFRARWMYVIECVLGVDINHDGIVGSPVVEQQIPPETKYMNPVWVHDDPENRLNNREVLLPTPKDDTLQHMAVILAARGWQYFTCDNFTNAKSETQLMSYDHWQNVFLPAMIAARLVSATTDSLGRRRVELTTMGKQMFLKLAGAVDREALPATTETVAYAQETARPTPRIIKRAVNPSDLPGYQTGRQTNRQTDRRKAR